MGGLNVRIKIHCAPPSHIRRSRASFARCRSAAVTIVMAISICFDTVGTYKANKVAKIEEKERNFNLCRQFSSFKTPLEKNVFLLASIFRVTLGRYPMFYDAQLAFLDEHQECQKLWNYSKLFLYFKSSENTIFFVNAQMFRFKD